MSPVRLFLLITILLTFLWIPLSGLGATQDKEVSKDTQREANRANNDSFFIDSIAAVVNDDIVTVFELLRQQAWLKHYSPERLPRGSSRDVLISLLDRMIDRTLILQEIKKTQFLTVPKSEIDKKYQEVSDRFSSPGEFNRILESIHFSIEDFYLHLWSDMMVDTYAQQKFRPQVRIRMEEITAYLARHAGRFNLSPDDVDRLDVPGVREARENVKFILYRTQLRELLETKRSELRKNADITILYPHKDKDLSGDK